VSPVEEFLRHLRGERNLSPHTVRAYQADLLRFADFLGGASTLVERPPDVAALRRYLGELHAAGYEKSSIARMLACLRTFYDYYLRIGRLAANPVRSVRTPKLNKTLPAACSSPR
jgi:integrase/recombinase XerC